MARPALWMAAAVVGVAAVPNYLPGARPRGSRSFAETRKLPQRPPLWRAAAAEERGPRACPTRGAGRGKPRRTAERARRRLELAAQR